MKQHPAFALFAFLILIGACAGSEPVRYDTILRGGTVYDGSGAEPFGARVAIHRHRTRSERPPVGAGGGHRGARAGHVVLTGEKLRTAGEIARVAGDPPPRGMVLYGRRLTVEPDVAATHGTSPGAPSRLREAGVRRRRDRV